MCFVAAINHDSQVLGTQAGLRVFYCGPATVTEWQPVPQDVCPACGFHRQTLSLL